VKFPRRIGARALASFAFVLWPVLANSEPARAAGDDTDTLSAAICPIVYQVDQTPFERGYHYLFYGNGFFINSDGYLITAAHVLSQLHGGQPYILVRSAVGPPQLVKAMLVIADREHDVAILRAVPNPFEGKYKVAFLPLTTRRLSPAETVLAAALRPSNLKDPHTFDELLEDRPSGEVVDYEFSQLDKGRGDTELFLFSHEVRPGQSGSPVVLDGSQEVAGLVEGRWLHPSPIPVVTDKGQESAGLSAAVPIHYAIALLQLKGIAWHTASGDFERSEEQAEQRKESSAPVPLSLVAAPYPAQALFGGEVVLDARVESNGRLADIRVVRGEAPFLEKILNAVRTWTFLPARENGLVAKQRIGIAFQFPQFLPSRVEPVHKYEEPLAGALERGALPILTVEPEYPPESTADGSVVLYGTIDQQGQLTSMQVLRDLESLSAAALAAVHQWRFVPGKQAGANTASMAIVVVTFHRRATAGCAKPASPLR
jgi:TonB family protein